MTKIETVPRLAGSAAHRPKRSLRLPAETGTVVALAVLAGLLGWAHRPFLEPANLISLLEQAALPGLLAIGMVFALTVREVDVSVGAVFHLAAVAAALLMTAGADPWPSAFAGIALGAVIGLGNGLVALTLRMPALIVTLGTWWMVDGLSLVLGKGQAIALPAGDSNSLAALSGKTLGGVPATVVIFVLLALVLHVVLTRTRFGYRAQATGSNPEAAAHAGIATGKVRLVALTLMGAIAALAGVIHLGAHGAVAPGDSNGLALMAIAAALLGGTRLSGGHGSVIGAAMGMLVVQVAFSGMTLLGVDAIWRDFAVGGLLVVALAADWLGRAWRSRRAELRYSSSRN